MYHIDLTQILLTVITIVGGIMASILTKLAYRALHLSEQSESRKVVATAIENGIALTEAQASAYAKEHGKLTVSNENVAKVAEYVLPKVQQSLDKLKVDDTHQLGEVIAARIAQRLAPPTVVAAPATADVTVKPARV